MKNSYHKFALLYGLRSLRRNRSRSVITISTVILSSSVTLVASCYSKALMKLWQDAACDTGLGHAQLHAEGYFKEPEGVQESLTILPDNPALAKLKDDAAVASFTRRLKFEGIISNHSKTLYFLGVGVDPESERKVAPYLFNPGNKIKKSRDEGEFVNDAEKIAVTVGKGMADVLNLKIGDEVTLVSQTVQGSLNGIDVIVRGIVDVPLPSFSKRLIYLHIDLAQRLLRIPQRFNEVAIRLRDPRAVPEWMPQFRPQAVSNKLELHSWDQLDPIIKKVEKIWDSGIGITSFLLFMSAALSVLNIVYLVVAERTVEIGTLMALGAKRKNIQQLFSLEASLMGIIGGILGVLLGNAIVATMGYFGVPFDSPFSSGTYSVYPKINPIMSGIVLFVSVATCYLAAIPPSNKASKVEPVRAFRGLVV